MVNNEKYTELLKSIVSCVSHGDYASAKELSHLELEKMENNKRKIVKEIKKYKKYKIGKNKKIEIAPIYAKYLLNKVLTATDLEDLKQQVITIDEFKSKVTNGI